MTNLLWIVVVALIVLWLFGLVFRVAGRFIHFLLVLALIVIVFNLAFHF